MFASDVPRDQVSHICAFSVIFFCCLFVLIKGIPRLLMSKVCKTVVGLQFSSYFFLQKDVLFTSFMLTDLFFLLSCLCLNVPFPYVLQNPTLSSLRHIIAPAEPGQVLQQAMIPLYTLFQNIQHFILIFYMDSLIYIFTQLQPENQNLHNHDKGNLSRCILAESPAACVHSLGPCKCKGNRTQLNQALFTAYCRISIHFSQIKSKCTIAWLSQHVLEN